MILQNQMDKKKTIAVVAGIVVMIIAFGAKVFTGSTTVPDTNSVDTSGTTAVTSDVTNQNITNATNTMQKVDQVQIQDVAIGTGDVATAGKTITVNYTGMFTDGKIFDSSIGKAPFTFVLGAGQVIKGWDMGVEGMKVGGKRVLVIPPQFGYGASDYASIPGNSTLIFQVELLGIK